MSGIAKRVASKILDTVPSCLSPSLMEIFKLRDFIDRSRRLVVVTGAGVSTESGIRGEDGVDWHWICKAYWAQKLPLLDDG